jgi:hypothetical protein
VLPFMIDEATDLGAQFGGGPPEGDDVRRRTNPAAGKELIASMTAGRQSHGTSSRSIVKENCHAALYGAAIISSSAWLPE